MKRTPEQQMYNEMWSALRHPSSEWATMFFLRGLQDSAETNRRKTIVPPQKDCPTGLTNC
jgi:hypothetical protein